MSSNWKVKYVKSGLIALIMIFVSGGANAFEMFFTAPGTRAMGMAGSFAAVANDSSAVYYNPAGLSQIGVANYDFTVDVGSVVELNENTGRFESNKLDFKFLGLSMSEVGDSKKWAWGLAILKPYQYSYNIPSLTIGSSVYPFGKTNVDVTQVSLATAYKFDKVSIGIGFDYLSSKIDVQWQPDFKDDATAVGVSVGVLYTPYQGDSANLRLGLVYKSGGQNEIASDDEKAAMSTTDKQLNDYLISYIPGKPSSVAFGVSSDITALPVAINLAAQIETIAWEESADAAFLSDYTKTSFGAEFSRPIADIVDLFVRAGVSSAKPDTEGPYSPEISSVTYGIGLKRGVASVEFCNEGRTIDFAGKKQNLSLSSLSLSLAW